MSSMGGDYIDTRAELLLDELAILPVGQNVDFNYWRGRFQTLFDEKLDDQTRQTLLMSYANMPDFVERSLVEQGQNPAQFQAARETDWRGIRYLRTGPLTKRAHTPNTHLPIQQK